LGSEWGKIKEKYNLTDNEMFKYFNVPALDDAVGTGKTIQFSHNPGDYPGSFLAQEWVYLQKKYNYKSLEQKGDVWIAE